MVDPNTLITAFDQYLATHPQSSRTQLMPRTGLRTSESLNAIGSVQIDLISGSVSSQVTGLPPSGTFDLWLTENRHGGQSTLADPQDIHRKVGTCHPGESITAFAFVC